MREPPDCRLIGRWFENSAGDRLAQCVDDLTLQADYDRAAKPKPGRYCIVSDDMRLLKLVSRVANAEDPVAKVLDLIANL